MTLNEKFFFYDFMDNVVQMNDFNRSLDAQEKIIKSLFMDYFDH